MSLNISIIKAICFDIDGTLADTDNEVVENVAKHLAFLKFVIPHLDLQKFSRKMVMLVESPGNSFLYYIDRFGIDETINWLRKHLSPIGHKINTHSPCWVEGADVTFKKLATTYPVAIVSARSEQFTQEFIHQMGIIPYLCCYASSATCMHTKPYPDPILWVSEQLKIRPENILIVGDTTVDIIAGKRAGAQTVGVLSGFGEKGELLKSGADLILNDVNSLASVLLNYPRPSP